MASVQEEIARLRKLKVQQEIERLKNKKREAGLKQSPAQTQSPTVATEPATVTPEYSGAPPKQRGATPASKFKPVPKLKPIDIDAIGDMLGTSKLAEIESRRASTEAIVDILNSALPGEQVSSVGGVMGVSATEITKSVKDIKIPPPVKPLVVEGKKRPIVEGTKELVEYLQAYDTPDAKSPFSLPTKYGKARKILDGFGGDPDVLHSRLRMIAKSEGKGAKWIQGTFNEIMNTANQIAPGAKVTGDGTSIKVKEGFRAPQSNPYKKPKPDEAEEIKVGINPLSTAEGATQFVMGALGGELKPDPVNERAASIGKTLGEVTKIATSIGASVSLGNTIALSSKSEFMKKIGGALANPNTNPIPDAVYAATAEDGNKFKAFMEGYAINLAAGSILEKNGLSLLVEMPGAERKVLKGHMEDLVKEYQRSDRLKKLNVLPDADLNRAEAIIDAIDNIDVVDMARGKRIKDLAARIKGITNKDAIRKESDDIGRAIANAEKELELERNLVKLSGGQDGVAVKQLKDDISDMKELRRELEAKLPEVIKKNEKAISLSGKTEITRKNRRAKLDKLFLDINDAKRILGTKEGLLKADAQMKEVKDLIASARKELDFELKVTNNDDVVKAIKADIEEMENIRNVLRRDMDDLRPAVELEGKLKKVKVPEVKEPVSVKTVAPDPKTPKPKKYTEMTDDDFVDFEPTSAVFDNIDELDLALKDKRIPLKQRKALPTPETQTTPVDDLPKKTAPTTDDVTQTNGKRGIFQREKKIVLDPVYEKARQAVKNLGKPTMRSIRNAFVKEVVDVSGNLKRELRKQGESGQLVIDRMEEALGASSKAKMRYENAMDDIFGKEIKSQNRKNLVSEIIHARRTIRVEELHPGIKHGDGIDPVRLKTRLAYLEQAEPEAFKTANAAADRYFNQMSSLLEDRYKAGLIPKDVYESLKGDIYSPREFLSHLNDSHAGLSSTLGQSDSGLKRILDGSDAEIVADMEYLMAKTITSAESQIASNNAGKQMYELLKSGEAGDLLVELKPLYGKNKQIKGYTKPPKGYDAVSVMIDGKKVQYGMKSDMASEFILKDPYLSPEVAKWVRIASGNNILKFNATQASTDFPLANVFRDVGTIMFANKEYSNFIPLASAQLGKDMASVFKDAVTRKGRTISMINQGGGMDYLKATAETWGTPGKKALTPVVRGVFDGLRWLGETSELMTRLSLRERALKNFLKQGMPLAEAEVKATLAARRYMDFGQGGSTVKALDNLMPYFNASIQGHRAWLRGAKNDPAGFTSKIMQVGGASAALTTYNVVNHEEAYNSIPDRIKETNWVFTTPHFRVDESGEKEYMYLAMPKPPGISSMFTVFEAAAESAQGRDVPYRRILMGLDDAMALGSIPPSLAASMALLGNIDTYTWEQIYKGGREIEKTAEITKNTPEWAIRAGEITGQSPERIRTAKSKFFTYRNGWVDASAATIDYAYSQMTDKEINETSEKLATPDGAPGLRRFIRFTSSEVSRNELGDELRAYNTRRKKQGQEMDKIIESNGDIKAFIDSQPREEQASLRQRRMNLRRNADIPKKFIDINSMASAAPIIKAGAMFREWNNAPVAATKKGEVTKKDIDEYTHRILGMGSPDFLRQYKWLKEQSMKQDRKK